MTQVNKGFPSLLRRPLSLYDRESGESVEGLEEEEQFELVGLRGVFQVR